MINTFWVGAALRPIEQLSLLSFLAKGHRVRLHTYEDVKYVPEGVELVDARVTVPFETTLGLRHKATGSYALASDYFRFLLQKESQGLWCDLDVVCLQPVRDDGEEMFGWESPDYVNGAVLYLKPESPVLDGAIQSLAPDNIPFWIPPRKRLPFRYRQLLRKPFGPADLPRGAFGPKALTALLERHGQIASARPREVFYPLKPREARWLYAPGGDIESIVTESSLTLHLWNEKLGELRHASPPANSPLGKLFRLYGL